MQVIPKITCHCTSSQIRCCLKTIWLRKPWAFTLEARVPSGFPDTTRKTLPGTRRTLRSIENVYSDIKLWALITSSIHYQNQSSGDIDILDNQMRAGCFYDYCCCSLVVIVLAMQDKQPPVFHEEWLKLPEWFQCWAKLSSWNMYVI